MNQGDSSDSAVDRFARALRGAPDTAEEASASWRARGRFLESVTRQGSSRRALVWVGVAIAGAVLVFGSLHASRLRFMTNRLEARGSGELTAAAGTEGELRFSDGTQVRVLPGSSVRLDDIGVRGAQVRLLHGRAKVQVAHRALARWTVEAGPLTIEVTGTAFDVEWQDPRLELSMTAGSVRVIGAPLKEALLLKAGERATIDIAERSVGKARDTLELDGGASTEHAQDPVSSASPSSSSASEAPANPVSRVSDAAPPTPTWAQRIASGDFSIVLREAELRGMNTILKEGSAAELAALGDAALYAGRGALAKQALLALRHRYPKNDRSFLAAFKLGRLAEDGAGEVGEAVRWYDDYLGAQPGGVFAAEARSRKMLALARAGRRSEAAAAARAYMNHHPSGPQAARASELAGER